jgi:hypothetical protein
MLLPSLILIAIFWLLGAALPATLATSLWLTFLYALSFIAGLFLYAEPSIEQAIYRNGPVSLMAALLAFAAAQVLDLLHALPLPQSGGYLLTAILAGSFPWFGVIAFLGLAKRFLVANNAALDYLKEAVLPYFLLHMFILSAFGYLFLEHSRLPGALQGVIIISCTVASLALLFEFVIKRVGPLRFLFGMKARPRV